VIPHFVGISVGKTKKPFTEGFTDGKYAPKKKRFPLEIYRRIFIMSVTLKLPTENIRRYIGR
jgi:hypothetical protein